MSWSSSSPSSSSPFTEGNFDYPPAPAPASRAARSTNTPAANALQRLRRSLERDREEEQAARDQRLAAAAREAWMSDRRSTDHSHSHYPSLRSAATQSATHEASPARRASSRRPAPAGREPSALEHNLRQRHPPSSSSSNNNSTTTGRPRATPSARYLRRPVREQRSTNMSSDADSSSVPDMPFNIFSYNTHLERQRRERESTLVSESEEHRRQSKRRKLEHDTAKTPNDGFKYGHQGQVALGRLKMEIVSCDGGEYHSPQAQGLYKVQNLLKNDTSVYCTKNSHCNVLLKHFVDAPFALQKIVIKAPDRYFTAPVQEGMVFISLSSDQLISGTAGYKIDYTGDAAAADQQSRESSTESQEDNEMIPLMEAINDAYIFERSLRRRQRAEERRSRAVMRQFEEYLQQPYDSILGNVADHCDWPTDASYATAAGVSAPTPPPFAITTESDNELDAEEEQPSPAVMADRLRRESRWRSDSEDEGDDLVDLLRPNRALNLARFGFPETHDRHEYLRSTRRREPSRIEPEPGKTESEGLIAPHARFFIAKDKNKITINFSPAVSGRFVLLKLWSPKARGNIDIESVQFYGYSGPRLFPAQEFR